MSGLEDLEKAAEQAIESHRANQRTGIGPTHSKVLAKTPTGKEADWEQIESQLEEINNSITHLLGIEKRPDPELKEKLKYDGRGHIVGGLDSSGLKISLGMGLIGYGAVSCFEPVAPSATMGLVASSAMAYNFIKADVDPSYGPLSGAITISDKRLGESEAYKTIAAELFHSYQHKQSDTWSHPIFREGLERAVSVKQLDQRDEDVYQDLYESLRAHVLVDGYAGIKDLENDLEDRDLYSIGLESSEARSYKERAGGRESQLYNLGASLIMAEELESSEKIYQEVFNSDYSSFPEIEELTQKIPLHRRLEAKAKGCF